MQAQWGVQDWLFQPGFVRVIIAFTFFATLIAPLWSQAGHIVTLPQL